MNLWSHSIEPHRENQILYINFEHILYIICNTANTQNFSLSIKKESYKKKVALNICVKASKFAFVTNILALLNPTHKKHHIT